MQKEMKNETALCKCRNMSVTIMREYRIYRAMPLNDPFCKKGSVISCLNNEDCNVTDCILNEKVPFNGKAVNITKSRRCVE